MPPAIIVEHVSEETFTIQNRRSAVLLKAWIENTKASGLRPLVTVVCTLINHWGGVPRCFDSRITNAILDPFNSLLQSAKATACAYPVHKNFINMDFLILGTLDLRIPT